MKKYRHAADAALGLVLLLGAFICTCIVVATAWYQVWWCVTFPDCPQPLLLPTYVSSLAMLGAVFLARRHLIRGRIPTGIYIALLCTTGVALCCARLWFSDPMHDIALPFGSHGRWGCHAINADGSPHYLLRDATVPWILFAPVALATCIHWFWSRRKGAQNNTVEDVAANRAESSP